MCGTDNHAGNGGAPRIVRLPLTLFPPLWWYRAMAAADVAVIDAGARYDKRRKSVHRFDIASTRGLLSLTVPVSHTPAAELVEAAAGELPDAPAVSRVKLWEDVTVSSHGRWWENAAQTLATAYGGTPWFDDLFPYFAEFFMADAVDWSIVGYALSADAVVRRLLRLPVRVTTAVTPQWQQQVTVAEPSQFPDSPYRQVRQDTLGFVPGLSVLDALFNLGSTDTRQLITNGSL